MNVDMKNSVTALLNARYKGDLYFYNIGISGHDFLRCVRNVHDATTAFHPQIYIIIETDRIEFDYGSMIAVLDGAYPYIASHPDGVIGFLQRFPWLRRLYAQYNSSQEVTENIRRGDFEPDILKPESEDYNAALSGILDLLTESAAGREIVIFFHPPIEFDDSGGIIPVADREKLYDFARLCDERGIVFVDLSDDFVKAYNDERKLPYGFSNTAAGVGHMNKYGHEITAERLYKTLEAMREEAGE
jgi:hypothetical protein